MKKLQRSHFVQQMAKVDIVNAFYYFCHLIILHQLFAKMGDSTLCKMPPPCFYFLKTHMVATSIIIIVRRIQNQNEMIIISQSYYVVQ